MAAFEKSQGFSPEDVFDQNAELGETYEPIMMNDGMDTVEVPRTITKDNIAQLFGGALPEGLSADIFDGDGTLELIDE